MALRGAFVSAVDDDQPRLLVVAGILGDAGDRLEVRGLGPGGEHDVAVLERVARDRADLLGRLALAQDDLGKAAPHRPVVIETRVDLIACFVRRNLGEREVGERACGILGRQCARSDLGEQSVEVLVIHLYQRNSSGTQHP